MRDIMPFIKDYSFSIVKGEINKYDSWFRAFENFSRVRIQWY